MAVLAAIIGVAVAASSASNTEGHAGHPPKKLFGGHWYRVDIAQPMDLTTDNFLFGLAFDYDGDTFVDYCDGGYSLPEPPFNTASCSSKWATPFQESINDWNAQPMDVNFIQTGTISENNDITILVTDLIFGEPGILGIALLFDSNGDWCILAPGGYDGCVYRYGVAWQADDPHSGVYGTTSVRRATVIHEIGHLINLRHESVNPDESQLYPCGQDNTGPIPFSVMGYNCIDPPQVQTIPGYPGLGISAVQDWDTCGVNHKYFDAAIGFGGCHSDSDGVHDGIDNCPTVNNPTQANFDGDAFGDACDPDIDGDGIANASDPEADGDRVMNIDEINCGSDPNDSSRRPERIDGIFAGVDDDGDTLVDEALPPGAANYDCDGDGYKGSVEAAIFAAGGNGDRDPCGINGWPSNLFEPAPGGFQPNTLNIQDLGSFVTPVRRFQKSSGDPEYSARWDLIPGSTVGEHINIQDLGALVTSTSGFPPMLLGARAFGKTCPWAP